MEASRKLLKYQRKRPIDPEEIEELYMNYDECPNCNDLIIESFVRKDYDKKLLRCRNCKSYFTPRVKNAAKRRKTDWIPTILH